MPEWEYCELWHNEEGELGREGQTLLKVYSARGTSDSGLTTRRLPRLLAQMGQHKWELVSVVVSPRYTNLYRYYFKRLLADSDILTEKEREQIKKLRRLRKAIARRRGTSNIMKPKRNTARNPISNTR